VCSRALETVSASKLNLDLQLYHAGTGVAAKARTENGGRRALEIGDLTKLRIGDVINGKAEVWMIEEIVELGANAQFCRLPGRQLRIFDYSEVGIDIGRSAKLISSLCELDDLTAAAVRRKDARIARVESRFATRSNEKRIQIRRATGKQLWRQTRIRSGWLSCTFSA
jgi:hypothetical protein